MREGQTVWICRHGERIDFVDPHWCETAEFPYDPPLSENGRLQARETAQRLSDEGIMHVFASPFLRTLETANPVAELLDLPIRVEQGASEALMSTWFPQDPRVLSTEDLALRFPRIDLSYSSLGLAVFPEDWEMCKARAARAARRIVAEYDEDLLLVGHGASVSSLAWGLVEGFPQFSGAMCGLVKLVLTNGRWTLALGGDTSHLSYTEDKVRLV